MGARHAMESKDASARIRSGVMCRVVWCAMEMMGDEAGPRIRLKMGPPQEGCFYPCYRPSVYVFNHDRGQLRFAGGASVPLLRRKSVCCRRLRSGSGWWRIGTQRLELRKAMLQACDLLLQAGEPFSRAFAGCFGSQCFLRLACPFVLNNASFIGWVAWVE